MRLFVASLVNSERVLDEMSIVDIFTRLIFDAESPLNVEEARIVELLCHVEPGLSGVSRRDLSEYLRSMGVEEMIQVVARLKHFMEQQLGVIANQGLPPNRHRPHR
jgi:hypothetical protein